MTSCIYTILALTHCLHCCTTCKNKNGNLEASKCVTRSGRGLTFSFWELHSTCICSYSGHNFNSFRPGLRSRSTECYSVIQVRVQEVQQNAQSRAELIIARKQLRLLKWNLLIFPNYYTYYSFFKYPKIVISSIS